MEDVSTENTSPYMLLFKQIMGVGHLVAIFVGSSQMCNRPVVKQINK